MKDYFLELTLQFAGEYGQINDEIVVKQPNSNEVLKSITPDTVDLSFGYFLNLLKSHLEYIDLFVHKMNSLNAKIKVPGQHNVSDCKTFFEILFYYHIY